MKTDHPAEWIVYMGKFGNRQALDRKEEELKQHNLAYDEVRDNPTLAPGLSLGRFEERAAATRAQEQFAQQGIHTGRVVELRAASSSVVLRVEKADAALAAKLGALKTAALGKGFQACANSASN